MWVRAALAYPTSFWTMTVAGTLIVVLDFVGIALMFHTIDRLGGFTLREVALLYGAAGLGLRTADLLIGSVEKIGTHVRTGTLDTMMVRPVPLLTQICADRFELRRLGQVAQAVVIFAWGAGGVAWSVDRVLVAVDMVIGGGLIFFALFVTFSCVQFWTGDASEFANAFTYGGNTIAQYPLTIYPGEVVKGLTFIVPIAFANWYSCLYLLGRTEVSSLPAWCAWLPLPVGLVMLGICLLVWRTGVRHYTSTGS